MFNDGLASERHALSADRAELRPLDEKAHLLLEPIGKGEVVRIEHRYEITAAMLQ